MDGHPTVHDDHAHVTFTLMLLVATLLLTERLLGHLRFLVRQGQRAVSGFRTLARPAATAEQAPVTEEEEEPDELCCPITFRMYRDPVMLVTGHTFEREAIVGFWERTPLGNPLGTGDRLQSGKMIINYGVRGQVDKWLEHHPGVTPGGWPSRDIGPRSTQAELDQQTARAEARATGRTTTPLFRQFAHMQNAHVEAHARLEAHFMARRMQREVVARENIAAARQARRLEREGAAAREWEAPAAAADGADAAARAAPARVRLEGALPERAEYLGVYELDRDRLVNGKPCYRKVGDHERMLWFTPHGNGGNGNNQPNWHAGPRRFLGMRHGWLAAIDPAGSPDRIVAEWQLGTAIGEWRRMPELRCVAEAEAPLPDMAPARDGNVPDAVALCLVHDPAHGALPVGTNIRYLGTYELCPELRINGRPTYAKCNDRVRRIWFAEGFWTVGTQDNFGTIRGWLRVPDAATNPSLVRAAWLAATPAGWVAAQPLRCEALNNRPGDGALHGLGGIHVPEPRVAQHRPGWIGVGHRPGMRLRFAVGTLVECRIGAGVWRRGVVTGHYFRERGWRPDQWAPYQVRLDGPEGELVLAPADLDTCIRLPPPPPPQPRHPPLPPPPPPPPGPPPPFEPPPPGPPRRGRGGRGGRGRGGRGRGAQDAAEAEADAEEAAGGDEAARDDEAAGGREDADALQQAIQANHAVAVAELRARREAERAWEAEADAQAAREREEREQGARWWAAGHLADEVIEVEDSEDDEEGT